jgi:hypothetical protein
VKYKDLESISLNAQICVTDSQRTCNDELSYLALSWNLLKNCRKLLLLLLQ